MEVRLLAEDDRPWVAEACRRHFGGETVVACGRVHHPARLRLLVTNDNTAALRFYQRRGWDLVALHRGAVEGHRRLKPEIPGRGAGGIPIRHLVELQHVLAPPGEAG